MSPIRINMVISIDEHPELHALLAERAPKARASVLRQHAEFGLWAKSRGGVIPATISDPAVTEKPKPAAANQTPPQLTNHANPPAPIAHATPPANKGEQSVLDTSVLAGVDLGGLD